MRDCEAFEVAIRAIKAADPVDYVVIPLEKKDRRYVSVFLRDGNEQSLMDNLQMRAMAILAAVTSLPAGFDPSATDAMAVVLKGNHSEYELGAGVEWAEFTDPFSGKTFMALKPNYDASRIATAYELIQRGNTLSDQLLNPELSAEELLDVEAELDELVVVLQMLREVNEVYGIISL